MSFIQLCMGMGSTAATTDGQKTQSWPMIVMLVVMFAAMYFLMIRPQKKKQQEEQKLRDSVQIGDEITTIGGINGKIVTVKEDSIVIETGTDRTKMQLMRWAIQTNNTANERAAVEKAALDEAKAKEKEERKSGSRRSKKSDSKEDTLE